MKHILKEKENKMNEVDLIKSAKSGDEKSLDELYSKYKHHILHIAKKYYLNDGNNDDLVQEGMFGFLKAINTFDENKGNFSPILGHGASSMCHFCNIRFEGCHRS